MRKKNLQRKQWEEQMIQVTLRKISSRKAKTLRVVTQNWENKYQQFNVRLPQAELTALAAKNNKIAKTLEEAAKHKQELHKETEYAQLKAESARAEALEALPAARRCRRSKLEKLRQEARRRIGPFKSSKKALDTYIAKEKIIKK